MTDEEFDGPAIITAMHTRDRETSTVAGSPKAWRRHDGLSWLHSHDAIGDHQLAAGRKLQEDWQASKIEASPRMTFGGGGSVHGVLSDSALDAGERAGLAMAVVVPGDQGLLQRFLMPDDHPLSLAQLAIAIKASPGSVARRIKGALMALARHYGFA